MDCPCCGKDCARPAEIILKSLDSMYMACPECAPEPNLDKSFPLDHLPEKIEECKACGKSPLDAVMLQALRILEEFGLRGKMESLRSVGSPLVVVGTPLAYPPRLAPESLIILGERLTKDAADEMLKRIPAIKGVILEKGVPGLRDSTASENILLAGCDLRCDVVQSIFGELVIYKSQSKIHIEFPRQISPKMKLLERLYLSGKIRNDVVDGLCGPGTLGLMCVLAGAQHVVLNDAWLPSVENAMLNLEVNRYLLGIEIIDHPEVPLGVIGREPVLVCRTYGACRIEVFHGDLRRLFTRIRPADLCLIDPFPGARIFDLKKACSGCGEIIIV